MRPSGRHDHFLLAAEDDEIAVFLALSDVAGVKPAVFERLRGFFGMLEVAAGYVFAAHQDFAVAGDLHFDAADRRADRALARVERVIQGHDGRGFGEAVALDHHESKLGEE